MWLNTFGQEEYQDFLMGGKTVFSINVAEKLDIHMQKKKKKWTWTFT